MEKQQADATPTIIGTLARRAVETPEAMAYWIEGDSVTYGQLMGQVHQTAHGLLDNGLKKNDICALALPTGLDILRSLYAVQQIGAVPVVINPGLPPKLIRNRLGIIGCDLLVASEKKLKLMKETPGVLHGKQRLVAAEHLRKNMSGQPHPMAKPEPDHTAYLQFTSGTTGEPRAAVIKHRSLTACLKTTADRLAIGPGDVLVGWVPLHHDLGLVRFAFGPVFFGCPAYLLEPSVRNFKQWLVIASKVKATITAGPDFGYRIAARMVDPKEVDLSALRFATNGGEPVRSGTISFFEKRFGLSGVVKPGYGLAEATLGVSSLAPGEPARVDDRGNVSCGRPYDGVIIRIAGDDGRPLPTGKTGDILVRGETVFSGYLGNKPASKSVLKNGWLHTGDVGKMDEIGHLYVLGRKRALIKRAGALIIPREIEEPADEVDGVRFSAAIGVERKHQGNEDLIVIAEIRPEASTGDLERKKLAGSIAEQVKHASGYSPGDVILVRPHTIPRTHNGKIRYTILKKMYRSGELVKQGKVLFGGSR